MKLKALLLFVLGLTAVLHAPAACNSDEPRKCAETPAHGPGPFPLIVDQNKYPACAARCGATALEGKYDYDALPSGTCSGDETCLMAAYEGCCAGAPKGVRGPLSVFRCRCEAGAWNCGVVTRGLATCCLEPALVDGGGNEGGSEAGSGD